MRPNKLNESTLHSSQSLDNDLSNGDDFVPTHNQSQQASYKIMWWFRVCLPLPVPIIVQWHSPINKAYRALFDKSTTCRLSPNKIFLDMHGGAHQCTHGGHSNNFQNGCCEISPFLIKPPLTKKISHNSIAIVSQVYKLTLHNNKQAWI